MSYTTADPGPPALRLASTGTLTYGLSVGEVLGVSTLNGARLIAGRAGLDRVVQRLNRARHHDSRLELLSAQERAILELIGEGLTNRQIASRMFLAEKTVKNYVSSLLAKIQVHSRTQAALFIVGQHARHDVPG